tara:strand:- start:40 stop:225 length:186 start_codon:yes stop_codon:yes gene_type:complete
MEFERINISYFLIICKAAFCLQQAVITEKIWGELKISIMNIKQKDIRGRTKSFQTSYFYNL